MLKTFWKNVASSPPAERRGKGRFQQPDRCYRNSASGGIIAYFVFLNKLILDSSSAFYLSSFRGVAVNFFPNIDFDVAFIKISNGVGNAFVLDELVFQCTSAHQIVDPLTQYCIAGSKIPSTSASDSIDFSSWLNHFLKTGIWVPET